MNMHRVRKKGPLYFSSNFAKCSPIFKITSLLTTRAEEQRDNKQSEKAKLN